MSLFNSSLLSPAHHFAKGPVSSDTFSFGAKGGLDCGASAPCSTLVSDWVTNSSAWPLMALRVRLAYLHDLMKSLLAAASLIQNFRFQTPIGLSEIASWRFHWLFTSQTCSSNLQSPNVWVSLAHNSAESILFSLFFGAMLSPTVAWSSRYGLH